MIKKGGMMSKYKKITIMFCVLLVFVLPALAHEIHDAAEKGDLDTVKSIIAKNPELVNVKDDFGSTPLHWAAMRGHREVFMFLIDKGADVNAKERHGGVPLHWAAHFDDPTIIEILIKKGAKVDEKNMMGRTPLQVAARRGCKKSAEKLIQLGADINAQNNHGETPLHIAAKGGHKQVIELLIAKGASEEIKDNNGKTPLEQVYKRPKPIKIDPKIYDAYIGQYDFGRGWRIEIKKKNNHLFYKSLVLDKLYPISENSFMSENELIQVTFVKNDKDEIDKIIYKSGERETTGNRIMKQKK
jgi:ankyrin repeat protein